MKLLGMVLAALLFGLVAHGARIGLTLDLRMLPGRLEADARSVVGTIPAGFSRNGLTPPGAAGATLSRVASACLWVRASLAIRVLPLLGALLLVGVTAGLLLRGRLAGGRGYASVTSAYLAKGGVALGLALYAFTALAPLGAPMWVLYLGAIVSSLGASVYVANLPPRM